MSNRIPAKHTVVFVYRNGDSTQQHTVPNKDLPHRLASFVEKAANAPKRTILRTHWRTANILELHQFTQRSSLAAYDAAP
jgi:transposase